MSKKLIEKVRKGDGKEVLVKMTVPKVVTAGINFLHFGPRVVLRSTLVLMRTNVFTRLISCLTMLGFDIADLVRKRISLYQFIKNCVLSLLMVLFGTIGWELGGRWIFIEALGIAAEIVGGVIGAGILSIGTNTLLTKLADKLIESDADKMWCILNPLIEVYNEDEKTWIKDNVSNSCLKFMYNSKDREGFAKELISTLHFTYVENIQEYEN
jgi:hypothetical protein